jgi:hypothetical protein
MNEHESRQVYSIQILKLVQGEFCRILEGKSLNQLSQIVYET